MKHNLFKRFASKHFIIKEFSLENSRNDPFTLNLNNSDFSQISGHFRSKRFPNRRGNVFEIVRPSLRVSRLLIGNNNANIVRSFSNSVRNGGRGEWGGGGWRPGTWITYYYLRQRRRLFAVGDPETRSPPKARRFMPRAIPRYFLNQISSLLSRSLPFSGLSARPPIPFRLDFPSRKWIFMKHVNNKRDNFLFASHSCLQDTNSFSLSLYRPRFPSSESSNHIVSVRFVLCTLFALSATSHRRMRRIRFMRRKAPGWNLQLAKLQETIFDLVI